MTKYRATPYGIRPYDVLNETNSGYICYTDDGAIYWEQDISPFYSWHDTFPQAQAELIRRTEQKIKMIEAKLESTKKLLKEYKKLKA